MIQDSVTFVNETGKPDGTGSANGQGAGHIILGGIESSRMTRAELALTMAEDVRRSRGGELKEPRIVVASNGLVIAKYHRDPDFRAAVEQANIVDVDGMPLVIATRFLCKQPLRERVATTDFINDACAAAAERGIKFYFLGGVEGRAAQAAVNLERAYPGLRIVGTANGYFEEAEEEEICRKIVESGADVLWLGLGSPRQEYFAIRNRHRLAGLAWIRTCGGLFDFYAHSVPRAPLWMQRLGLEWMFRSLHEPRRLGIRYLATNPVALFHLLTKTRG